MKDIETRKDLEKLLTEFYKIAIVDREIGHHFDDLDLELHLPIIVNFWEKVIFGKPVYFGDPVAIHKSLHEIALLKIEHFQRWLKIFCSKVDELFAGKKAENIKLRAETIARSLNRNLNGN